MTQTKINSKDSELQNQHFAINSSRSETWHELKKAFHMHRAINIVCNILHGGINQTQACRGDSKSLWPLTIHNPIQISIHQVFNRRRLYSVSHFHKLNPNGCSALIKMTEKRFILKTPLRPLTHFKYKVRLVALGGKFLIGLSIMTN